jgi:hypothetical protein
MRDPLKAKKAAEELGTELAKCGARLLAYGGPYLEADVVRGFVVAFPRPSFSQLMPFSHESSVGLKESLNLNP